MSHHLPLGCSLAGSGNQANNKQCSAYAEQSSLDNQCCPLEGSHHHSHLALLPSRPLNIIVL
eukprot:8191299-Heterocapsa_arctica.AAC.1